MSIREILKDGEPALSLSLIHICGAAVDGMDCCTTMLCMNCLCGGCN